jgi:hypothetical protein
MTRGIELPSVTLCGRIAWLLFHLDDQSVGSRSFALSNPLLGTGNDLPLTLM